MQPQKKNSAKKVVRKPATNRQPMAASKATNGQVGVSAAYSSAARSSKPVDRASAGSRRIIHRELVTTIPGSVGFASTKVNLQPGNVASFPWLSSQAGSWEQYRFHRLSFEFLTRKGTDVSGSVIMAPDYDASDPAPLSEVDASAYKDAIEDVVWRDLHCRLDPASMFSMGNKKFVRDGCVSGDIKTFDAGNLFISTIGMADTSDVGKLWVSYDIELFTPQKASVAAASSTASVYRNAAAQVYASTVAELSDFDTTVADPLGIGDFASGVVTLPKGAFLCEFKGSYFDSANEAFTVTAKAQIDGVASTTYLQVNKAGAATNESIAIPLTIYVVSDGTTTLGVSITLVGAAGTLTQYAESAILTVRAI